jgi:hypothetical protein
MNCLVTVYSKLYLETEDESWSARPTKNLMRRLHSQDSARWIAAFDGGRISVGDPVSTFTSSDALFVPSWFLDTLGLNDGAQVDLAFEKSEALPKATRLSFKVIGDIPADMDVRDLLEEPLSQLGVLEVGQMIPVPILEGTMLLLQECEPENVVFLDGEADLEIENETVATPVEEEAAPLEEEEQAQVPVFIPQEIDFSSMLSLPAPTPSGFVPFSGVGRTLGGDKGRTLGGDGRTLGGR